MQIVYHIGANCTDQDRLLKSILKNSETFAQQGVKVPGPGKYRRLIRETIQALEGNQPANDTREILLDAILDDEQCNRLVMSHSQFMCVHRRVFESGVFYALAETKLEGLASLFPDDEIEIFLGLRDPATYLPAIFGDSPVESFSDFMRGVDPLDLRWSDLVARIRKILPNANLTVWCNEDTPLIWAQLIREVAGVDPLTKITGGFDLLSAIMSAEGMKKFVTYLKSNPPQTEQQKRRIIAAFLEKYADVFKGDDKWQGVETTDSQTYDWPSASTYVQNPPYFQGMTMDTKEITNIEGAKVLAVLGDMVTTDHISPAGSFKDTTPAGQYLVDRQVPVREFNSYGSRRGNHEVMMRGTFANIRIKNEMLPGVEGGYTNGPDGAQTSIYDAAMAHQEAGTPLVIFGGEQYGAGSSRDWAAKGTALLGVKAVIAESFERIHRSNLVGMGVIPFEFTSGDSRKSLGLTGEETVAIKGLDTIKPLQDVPCEITMADGSVKAITLKCRIDTAVEIEYIENGGVLHYVLRNLAKS